MTFKRFGVPALVIIAHSPVYWRLAICLSGLEALRQLKAVINPDTWSGITVTSVSLNVLISRYSRYLWRLVYSASQCLFSMLRRIAIVLRTNQLNVTAVLQHHLTNAEALNPHDPLQMACVRFVALARWLISQLYINTPRLVKVAWLYYNNNSDLERPELTTAHRNN